MKKVKIFIIGLIIIIISIILFIFLNNNNSIKNKGYSKEELIEINKLSKEERDIINNNDYNENLINIIKNDNYKSENLQLYLEYYKNYNDVNTIINYVNNYLDKIEFNKLNMDFLSNKYFILKNLDRYIKYYNAFNLSIDEVIRRINSNLDLEFYKDVNKADLSKEMYTLVNKFFYLDKNYVPDNLVNVTGIYARDSAKIINIVYDNFKTMADDARKEDLTIKITTGYRSYNFQSTLYNNYVKSDGVNKADTYSARPGYSEHQLGYSIDLTNKNNVSFDEFDTTKEFVWLSNNAYKYGFILRYPKDKEYLTGYNYESWHYRYVGYDIAKYIYENNITYEEYYAYFIDCEK